MFDVACDAFEQSFDVRQGFPLLDGPFREFVQTFGRVVPQSGIGRMDQAFLQSQSITEVTLLMYHVNIHPLKVGLDDVWFGEIRGYAKHGQVR